MSGHPPEGVFMGGRMRGSGGHRGNQVTARKGFPTHDHPPGGLLMEERARGKQGKQGRPCDGGSFPRSPGLWRVEPGGAPGHPSKPSLSLIL